MKTKAQLTLILVALLAYWVGLCNASAFYDPGTQRWLNRDPFGEIGGINMHEYVGNQPISNLDPDGRFAWVPICCTAAALFVGWDIYDMVKSKTCAGLTGSALANCVLKQVLSQAGLDSLGSCISSALATNGGGKGTTAGILDCFKKCGIRALRDAAKDASIACCMGGLVQKIYNSLPNLPNPLPAPASAYAP